MKQIDFNDGNMVFPLGIELLIQKAEYL